MPHENKKGEVSLLRRRTRAFHCLGQRLPFVASGKIAGSRITPPKSENRASGYLHRAPHNLQNRPPPPARNESSERAWRRCLRCRAACRHRFSKQPVSARKGPLPSSLRDGKGPFDGNGRRGKGTSRAPEGKSQVETYALSAMAVLAAKYPVAKDSMHPPKMDVFTRLPQ